MGAKRQVKGRGSRRPDRQAPRWAPAPQVQPVPLGFRSRDARGGAPCIGKPKSPSPLGSCAAGSAHAARVQPRGCKGRSPLHEITLVSPFPAGEGGRGDRGQKGKLKAGAAGDRAGKPPAGLLRRRFSPCRPGSAPGDARGGAPCIRKPKSPSPPGSCTAGSARAASGSGAGMQGAKPLA